MIDTSRSFEFRKSTHKMIGLVALGILFIVASVWLINGGAVDGRRGAISTYVGWCCFTVFGFYTLVRVARLIVFDDIVVVVSSTGIHNMRITSNEISWTDLSAIGEWKYGTHTMLRLYLTGSGKSRLRLTLFGRFYRWLNVPFLGFSSVLIDHYELKSPYDNLMHVVSRFAEVHRPDLFKK